MAVCGSGQRLLPKLFIHKKNLSYFERDIYLYFDPIRCISSPKYFYTHMMNHIFLHEKGFLFVLAEYSCVHFPFKCQSPNRLFSLPIRQRRLLVEVAITDAARDHHKLQKFPILKRESYSKELIIAVKDK